MDSMIELLRVESPVRYIANLWSLADLSTATGTWPLERQVAAIKEAGFDGFTALVNAEHARLAARYGLLVVAHFASSDVREFGPLLAQGLAAGAEHINVRLADHDTPADEAVQLAIELIEEARALDLCPSIEVHRDTCTETPEKTYALAEAYHAATGELLPLAWDFSHFAVVKHLSPPFSRRLLVRPDLVQRAQQFRFRPFNKHHCQVAVTDGRGGMTAEVRAWLPFVEDAFRMWRERNHTGREIFVVPEMGPMAGGYRLSTLPNSWEEAKVLRSLLADAWKRSGQP